VKPGDMIVTTGSQSLENGTKVKVGLADDDDDAKPAGDDAKPAAGEPKAGDAKDDKDGK